MTNPPPASVQLQRTTGALLLSPRERIAIVRALAHCCGMGQPHLPLTPTEIDALCARLELKTCKPA